MPDNHLLLFIFPSFLHLLAILYSILCKNGIFYDTLSANTGLNIYDDKSLVRVLGEFSGAKKEYDKFAYALSEVNRKGYGIVFPSIDELSLEEPEIIKQGNKFGVRLKASAPSFHLIRADIETEVLTDIIILNNPITKSLRPKRQRDFC